VDIGGECELYLTGRYGGHLEDRALPRPVWVWLNPLAHGTAAELAAVTAEPGDHTGGSWASAQQFLAGEVLAVVEHDPERLRTLQRDVLVPFELELAADWFTTPTPSDVVRRVCAELQRTRRRHPQQDR
jgi:hypothetical protein